MVKILTSLLSLAISFSAHSILSLFLLSFLPTLSAIGAEPAEKESYEQAYKQGAKYYQLKKYSLARTELEKAALSPADDGEAGILLGYTYFAQKQYDKALKQYKTVADNGRLLSVKSRADKLYRTLWAYKQGICPGNCLKASTPGWRKMHVDGKPDYLVWMVFPYLDPAGKGGSEYWSNDHMGEVIEYVNGRPINRGRCPLCGGTGKVSLPR